MLFLIYIPRITTDLRYNFTSLAVIQVSSYKFPIGIFCPFFFWGCCLPHWLAEITCVIHLALMGFRHFQYFFHIAICVIFHGVFSKQKAFMLMDSKSSVPCLMICVFEMLFERLFPALRSLRYSLYIMLHSLYSSTFSS